MCGFVGFANFKEDVSKNRDILEKMANSLKRRGPDEEGYYITKNIALGHKRLIVVDPENRKTTNDWSLLLFGLCNCI